MNQSNLKMNLKNHQYNLIFLIFGILIGASLHYFFNENNIEYVQKKAYQDGRKDCREEIIKGILYADTTFVTEQDIQFYYK